MKILVIAKWMVKWNGASKVAYELSKQFKEHGHDVRIIAYGDHIDPDWEREFTFYRLHNKGLLALPQLRSIVLEYRPDVIHSHDWLGLLVVGQGVPLVSTNHSNWPMNWFFGWDTFFAGILQGIPNEIKMHLSDAAISVSKYQQIESSRRHLQSQVIFNGIDEAYFSLPSEPAKLDSPSLLFVGSVDNRKAKYLLPFIDCLSKKRENVKLYVIGPAVDNDIVSGFSNYANVVYLGVVDDVRPYYRAADALVFLSRMEMCPMVLIESVACGLPIVAFDVCSHSEIIEDGKNGFLVREGDIEAAVSATLELLKSPDLRRDISQNNINKAKLCFSWSEKAEFYLSLFNKLVYSLMIKHDAK
jgi:glycosyltransferase involved in cell wall biosynthesis